MLSLYELYDYIVCCENEVNSVPPQRYFMTWGPDCTMVTSKSTGITVYTILCSWEDVFHNLFSAIPGHSHKLLLQRSGMNGGHNFGIVLEIEYVSEMVKKKKRKCNFQLWTFLALPPVSDTFFVRQPSTSHSIKNNGYFLWRPCPGWMGMPLISS